jgi:hypothetical protein
MGATELLSKLADAIVHHSETEPLKSVPGSSAVQQTFRSIVSTESDRGPAAWQARLPRVPLTSACGVGQLEPADTGSSHKSRKRSSLPA